MRQREFYENYLSEDFELLNKSINNIHALSILTVDKLLSAEEEDMKEAELAAYRLIHNVEVIKALRNKKIKRDKHRENNILSNKINPGPKIKKVNRG